MKTRIACLYGDIATCGRNDGGPLYACSVLRAIFGQENVMHLFPKGDLSRFGKFDFHWLTDWGEDALGYQDFEVEHPSIYWASDTHLGYEYRLARAKRCDWVFCAQEQAVTEFIRDGIPAERCFWPQKFWMRLSQRLRRELNSRKCASLSWGDTRSSSTAPIGSRGTSTSSPAIGFAALSPRGSCRSVG